MLLMSLLWAMEKALNISINEKEVSVRTMDAVFHWVALLMLSQK